jgi:hypothetical protein
MNLMGVVCVALHVTVISLLEPLGSTIKFLTPPWLAIVIIKNAVASEAACASVARTRLGAARRRLTLVRASFVVCDAA